jgi:hypothetical protein
MCRTCLSSGHRMTWRSYHPLADIHGYLDYLANTYPPFVNLQTIGTSVAGRPLRALKISSNRPGNPAIWIDGGERCCCWYQWNSNGSALVSPWRHKTVQLWCPCPPIAWQNSWTLVCPWHLKKPELWCAHGISKHLSPGVLMASENTWTLVCPWHLKTPELCCPTGITKQFSSDFSRLSQSNRALVSLWHHIFLWHSLFFSTSCTWLF